MECSCALSVTFLFDTFSCVENGSFMVFKVKTELVHLFIIYNVNVLETCVIHVSRAMELLNAIYDYKCTKKHNYYY